MSKLEKPGMPKARLRFDKVVVRVLENLRASLRDEVPRGMSVLVTISAPIRLPSKTTEQLLENLKGHVKGRVARADSKLELLGNQIRFRLVETRWREAPPLLGLVYSPGTDAGMLLDAMEEMSIRSGRAAKKNGTKRLEIEVEGGELAVYRAIAEQLGVTIKSSGKSQG